MISVEGQLKKAESANRQGFLPRKGPVHARIIFRQLACADACQRSQSDHDVVDVAQLTPTPACNRGARVLPQLSVVFHDAQKGTQVVSHEPSCARSSIYLANVRCSWGFFFSDRYSQMRRWCQSFDARLPAGLSPVVSDVPPCPALWCKGPRLHSVPRYASGTPKGGRRRLKTVRASW